jgi:predicted glycosyltransferase involved in capsule biosynthesis
MERKVKGYKNFTNHLATCVVQVQLNFYHIHFEKSFSKHFLRERVAKKLSKGKKTVNKI